MTREEALYQHENNGDLLAEYQDIINEIFDQHEQRISELGDQLLGMDKLLSDTSLELRKANDTIAKLETPKTCNGCVHLKKNWADIYKCYHPEYNECERLYITQRIAYYEPKGK